MKRSSEALWMVAAALVVAVLATGQGPRRGWKLQRSDSPGKVHFTVERSREGSHWSHSSDVPLSAFHGFSLDTFQRDGNAKFEYTHDAGRLLCEGRFVFGRGSGEFTFDPNPQFAPKLRQIGYDTPDEDQLFSMLMTDVSLEFARGVKDAIASASTQQLIDLRIHGVSLDYIHETQQAGYRDISARDYVEMRIHGVQTAFLRDLRSFGYDLVPRDVIELRIHGVTSEFVRDLKKAGYDLPAKKITELRIHGVTSDYLRDLKSYGLRPDASDLVELRIHGVTPEYLRGLADAGYKGLEAKEITQLRTHGVNTDFVEDARNLGYDFTPRELVELRIHGVNGEYLQHLKASGMKNLTAAQIAKLKIHGVE